MSVPVHVLEYFLGGKSRNWLTGAKLGFHRPWIVKEREKRLYEANRVEEKWEDEFDYVTMIYDVAMQDMLEGIKFMRSRGVDIGLHFENLFDQ